MEYKIEHNKEKSRFEAISSEGKVIGLVDYHIIPNPVKEGHNTMVIPHTGVDQEYEGKGIAGALNKAILNYALENGYSVSPTCSYTKTYIDRHPEYTKLID